MMERLVISLFCLAFGISNAQQVRFRLVANDSTAAVNVKAVNLVSEKTAVSDASGEFIMEVKTDELLVFPSEQYGYKRYLVDRDDLKGKAVTIKLIKKAVELDEVRVGQNHKKEYGVDGSPKAYTPVERKMATATTGSAVNLASNLVSGKIKMLRRQLKVEQKEALMETMDYQFPDSYYTRTLKIPSDYVKGFQYYCLEDKDVEKALRINDRALLSRRVPQLALEYVDLIALEENEVKP